MGRRGGRPPRCRGALPVRPARRPVHADIHLGHQRRSQGGDVQSGQGRDRRRDDDRPVQPRPPRCLLRIDAAVPFQCCAGGVGGVIGLPRLNGVAAQVLCIRISAGHPPLRRHLRQLRRQAVVLCARHTAAPGRRRQSAACGLRQRGSTRRHRAFRRQIRLRRHRRLRVDGGRGGDQPHTGYPDRRTWSAARRASRSAMSTPVSLVRLAWSASW